jgi:hypothetical protein
MGDTISRLMDFFGKRINDVRKGSPIYREKKRRWKNKKDIANYRMVRGEDLYEDEIFESCEDGVQVVRL